ncbi:MAG: hypothetical protein K2J40_09980 [Ruminococcus sp.]|nr:hypothetical protein [Ruminococcus sp.]
MEKFEIDAEGTLTAYHNENKDITELTVPDGVKYLNKSIFKEYGNIGTLILPDSFQYIERKDFIYVSPSRSLCHASVHTVIYRGVKFSPSFYVRDIFVMIRDKDYSCVLSHDLKYPVILQIYFNDGDDITTAYIKKNFKKFFVFLINELDVQNRLGFSMHIKDALNIIERLVKSGKFITKRNIETYIKIVDEKECYEVFDMLNEYKEENNF